MSQIYHIWKGTTGFGNSDLLTIVVTLLEYSQNAQTFWLRQLGYLGFLKFTLPYPRHLKISCIVQHLIRFYASLHGTSTKSRYPRVRAVPLRVLGSSESCFAVFWVVTKWLWGIVTFICSFFGIFHFVCFFIIILYSFSLFHYRRLSRVTRTSLAHISPFVCKNT